MSEQHSRREWIQQLTLAGIIGGLEPALAQHVHDQVKTEKKAGPYQPKAFRQAEFKQLEILCELIVPGASKGSAAEFLDLIASENPPVRTTLSGGLAWLNAQTLRDHQAAFADATPAQQTALLDKIAFRANSTPETVPAIRFFDLARRMTVDAYYTSAAGIAELGYLGNKGQSEFRVPQDAIDYALRRSNLA
jgi:gluconate 2-dehydrogenase gamma chain